jgi:hypothetical protein
MRITLTETVYNKLKLEYKNRANTVFTFKDSQRDLKNVKIVLKDKINKLERKYILNDSDFTVTVEGWVILVKNPALHQGDMR